MLRRDDSPTTGVSSKGRLDRKTAYQRPNHGIFHYLPEPLVPYAELMRLDRLSGFWAFWWHYLIGLGFALHLPLRHDSETSEPTARYVGQSYTPTAILSTILYLYVWTTLFRGFACTWNDLLDAPFDRQVARTKFRPVARGAIGTKATVAFVVLQGTACVWLVAPLNAAARAHALIMGALLFIYPFLKRVTDFPQVELGLVVSWAIFFVCACLDHDLWTLQTQCTLKPGVHSEYTFGLPTAPSFKAGCFLYLSGAIWHITVDTVYAHQDYEDDRKAGVRSMAVWLGRERTKPALIACGLLQVLCAIMTGCQAGFGTVYFVVGCGGTSCSLVLMLVDLRLDMPDSCAFWFGPGSRLVGASMVAGLVGEYIALKL